jgi:secreted PhoX family phosphatase
MKKITGLMIAIGGMASAANAQNAFPLHIDTQWSVKTVWMPKSPLNQHVVFVGGVDTVQTTATYGNSSSKTVAKQWHDFIGVVRDNQKSGEGWVIVNHEMTVKNDQIGDGGGMTTFKLKRQSNDQLEVVPQTLSDGRSGKFFNVDFANTVGETGMNCGGINGGDRIWTAEEWMQSSNRSISSWMRDTSDFIIGTTTPAGFPGFNGKKLPKYKNLNWMVEIDPKTAKAVRKQYNWGRAGWEGGVLMPDKKTVYLFEDGSPGILAKFIATTAGDFTSGQLYVYKQDAPTKWIEIENNLDTLSELNAVAIRRGASMFNRLEWGAYSNGRIYITETGRDAFNFSSGIAAKGVISQGLIDGYKYRFKVINGRNFSGTDAQAADSVRQGKFFDYYGRVLEFDPMTNMIRSYIEGGPYWIQSGSQNRFAYPPIHLSNPDGIDFMKIGKKTYMIIQEDLNGSSWNRMPAGITQTICETYLLDMEISNPAFKDLVRITACSPGAEITGATMFDDRTMLLNAQHPSTSNTFPYNNSLTYAITGFQDAASLFTKRAEKTAGFNIYPNPAAKQIQLSEAMDVAIYNTSGQRIKVSRGSEIVDISDLSNGVYFIRNEKGETVRLVVQ